MCSVERSAGARNCHHVVRAEASNTSGASQKVAFLGLGIMGLAMVCTSPGFQLPLIGYSSIAVEIQPRGLSNEPLPALQH
jgi:hypothetical protein